DESTAPIIFDYLDSLTNKNEKIKEIVDFIKEIGPDAARKYFYAIKNTKSVAELTDERLLHLASFIKEIGPYAAGAYFSAIGYAKSVAEKYGNEATELIKENLDKLPQNEYTSIFTSAIQNMYKRNK
ncbi:MAG: hypothetical protein ACP5T6_03420, partial [Candidatus Micrarchaeia archaeon]